MCLFLTLSNKSQPMPNFLRICVQRRERQSAQETVLGNQYKRNSVWSHSSEVQRSRMSHNFLHHRTTEINRALLDLGVSINFLPLSVYQQLGLDELSPTRVTIQLADRSVKIPKGKIKDVLIWVGDFIYPVDFIVLETQPVSNLRSQTLVILGRPFFITASAIINCSNGSMRLTFEGMTKEVNVFNLGRQPRNINDQTFEVNSIENLTSEHEESMEIETEAKFDLESEDFNLD